MKAPPPAQPPVPNPVAPHPTLGGYYGDDADRRGWVTGLFDRTARHYGWLNAFLSLGSGRLYRWRVLQRAGLEPGMRLLDVATGTGLVAGSARKLTDGGALGLDASFGMLQQARRLDVPLLQGLAEELPVADASMDVYTMGYALRHVADLGAAFREAHRVLRPGGKLVLLELVKPEGRGPFSWFFRFYLRTLAPAVARLGGAESRTLMRYYWDTIEQCVPAEVILRQLAEAGFEEPASHQTGPVLREYTARKS